MERQNGLPPVHPGEILREDILPKAGLSVIATAKALGVSCQIMLAADVFEQDVFGSQPRGFAAAMPPYRQRIGCVSHPQMQRLARRSPG